MFAACESSDTSTESTAELPMAVDAPWSEAERFAAPIEDAHGLMGWREQPALRADITVSFGGNTILEADMLMRTDMSHTRLERADGTVAIWDGTDAWVSPASAEFARARFHVLTWPYFLSAPMKLRDPGTHIEPLGETAMGGETFETARLTFDAGVGDTPDDWYVLYRDETTDRLHGMAYIVTYGTNLEQAEAEPHAITYHDFVDVEGVAIPTRWTFWLWNETNEIHGEPIGSVALDDVRFTEPSADAFTVPDDASQKPLPSS